MVFKIKNTRLENNVFLAPMEGITVMPFRVLCKQYGAGIVFTEMVHVNAIARENPSSMRRAMVCSEERPAGVQLFGSKIDIIKKAAGIIEGKIKCDLIDFNFGCPAPKVVNAGAGAALLARPKRIGEIISTLVSCTGKPVSAKIRLCNRKEDTLKVAKEIEKAGASFVTVHARTPQQGYSGKADWSWIKKIKEAVNIPVVGNGDVFCRQDYLRMLEETGCDAVMIGRAAMSNPAVFSEILHSKKFDKMKLLKEFFELCSKYDYKDIAVIKQHAQQFTKGLPNSAKMRVKLTFAKTTDDIQKILSI